MKQKCYLRSVSFDIAWNSIYAFLFILSFHFIEKFASVSHIQTRETVQTN